MKQIVILLCALFALTATIGAQEKTYKEKQPYKGWVRLAPTLDDAFLQTEEAKRIGDNLLLYQHNSGGWPKNIYMPAELTEEERKEVLKAKDDVNESTIDNSATTTEIRYLSRLYNATKIEKYRDAALRGIEYVLESQYDNGGFPQFYPRPKGYYTHITYNDNAMVNVLKVIREVYEKRAPYGFISDELAQRARAAFDKGIDCILKTQVKQNGRLTVWCAQHDEHTLLPAKARAYELPSLSGAESDNIVHLLFSLPNPSQEVIDAIEGAVAWFEANQIKGLRFEYFTNEEGKKDYRMVPCTPDAPDCPPLWARFYTLEENRPFFCDRDGVMRFNLSEIGHERRTGYSWYNKDGAKVLRDYKKWKKKLEKQKKEK